MTGTETQIIPTPKQKEAKQIADKNFITLYGGAIRGGKSYWLLLTFITYCFKYPKSRWLIVRESMPTMERTILHTFQTKFLDIGFNQYVTNFNKQTMTVTWNNGSQIIFMAENYDADKELNRFRGLEINGAGVDEANEIREETFNKLIERSGSWIGSEGCPTKILLTCNPSQGWVKTKFYKRYVEQTLPDSWAYVPAKITDNPHVTEGYKESLKNLPPDQYKIFVEGDWNAFSVNKPFAYAFDENVHVDSDSEYSDILPLWLSFDFNIDPITCLVAQHHDDDDDFLDIIAEFKLKDGSTDSLCDAIIAKFGHYNPTYFVTGDATGNNRSALTGGNINHYYIIKNKLGLASSQIKTKKRNMSPKNLRVLTNSLLQNYDIRISPKCETYINDLKYVEVDDNGDIKKDRSNENRKADLLDCGNYLYEAIFPTFVKFSQINSNYLESEEII